MSHDFAKAKGAKKTTRSSKPNSRKPEPAPRPGLPRYVWFFGGVACTLFAQLLFHLSTIDTSTTQAANSKAAPKKPEKIEKPAPRRPKIEFYNTLKEREVKVSGEVVAEREQEDYSYALQAGAFRKRSDAETQRVKIGFLGLESSIEANVNKSGTTYHRIIVGPFTSRSNLSSARNTLIKNGIQTMRIKRK